MVGLILVAAAAAQTCGGPELSEPAAGLSVAWVSPLHRRAGGGRWLEVVPTAQLRAFAQGQGNQSVARTLQRVGLRRRSTEPSRRFKVVVFDVAADALCRPLVDHAEGELVAGVRTCDERRSKPSGSYDGCGWVVDLGTGEAALPAYRAQWRELAVNGFCVLPLERFVRP